MPTGVRDWMDRTFYPDHGKNWDDQLFRDRILTHLRGHEVILDVGAGAGIVSKMNLKGRARKICGIDLDPRVVDNPLLDEGRICDAVSIPYPSNIFDLAFADNVIEHLEEPRNVFLEIARVLKPGGLFLFKTPNKWHYVPAIARWTPHAFHQFINARRGRVAEDTFPTLYRANTTRDVKRLAADVGFEVVAVERIEHRPEYLRMTIPTYIAGLAYERLVNSMPLLERFRVILVGHLRKPGVHSHDRSPKRGELFDDA